MRTLLLSGILYLIGISLVLLYRPRLMFNADGTWKEFGTVSPNHTIFPFWMFCIAWAIISYVLITLASRGSSGAAAAVTTTLGTVSSLKPVEPPEDLVAPLPPRTKKKKNTDIHTEYGNMKPGYYVLDTKAAQESGVPKYIYMGDKPKRGGKPSDSSDSE